MSGFCFYFIRHTIMIFHGRKLSQTDFDVVFIVTSGVTRFETGR